MSYFDIGGQIYCLESVKWIRDQRRPSCQGGEENKEDPSCDSCKNGTCTSSLRKHCCKHVVRSAEEKEKADFIRAAKYPPEQIPSDKVNKKIMDRYQRLAEEEVLSGTPIFGVDVSAKKVLNIFCSNRINDVELVDYLTYPDDKNDEPQIVSMYGKDYDFETAFLLYCCYQKYETGAAELPNMLLTPSIEKRGDYYQSRYPVSWGALENGPLLSGRSKKQCEQDILAYYCTKKREASDALFKQFAASFCAETDPQAFVQYLPPQLPALNNSKAYRTVSFNLPAFRSYVILSSIRNHATTMPKDPVVKRGFQYRPMSSFPCHISLPSDKEIGAIQAETVLLWYYLQAEKDLLMRYFSDSKPAAERLKEKMELEDHGVFNNTAFSVMSSVLGYIIALIALLRNVGSKLNRYPSVLGMSRAVTEERDWLFYSVSPQVRSLVKEDERFKAWTDIYHDLFPFIPLPFIP